MTKGQYLTTSQKDRKKPALLLKQGGLCLFCNEVLKIGYESKELRITYDHLDDNPKNNDDTNLALVHWVCNQQKKSYPEYKLIAQAQLKKNIDSLSVCDIPAPEHKQTSKEIDINVAFYKITKDYLNERLIRQGKPAIEYNDTKHSIAYIMKEQTGHGSSETAKRHIEDFCSTAAPFKREQDQNGIWNILKRT